jgi:hypothetical protein
MKKVLHNISLALLLAAFVGSMQSCKKEADCSGEYTYTYFMPVYQTAAVVRANVRSNAPQAISNPGKIYIKGNYIFLNEINKGIHVIDNSNPAVPVNASFISLPGNVDISVKGNTLYADFYTELVVLDISDPLQVSVKKFVENVFPERYYYGYSVDSNMVITDWIKKTETVKQECGRRFDIGLGGVLMNSTDVGFNKATAAASPVGIAGSLARFALINNYLYSVSDDSLRVINVTVPHNPIPVRAVGLEWGIETIFPFKDKLFIGSRSGMFIYGLQDPASPNKVGSFTHVRTCDPVIADGDYAYVTLFSGNECAGFTNQLEVLNITNISNPVLIKTYPLTGPQGLSKDGNLLFICDGTDGLKVFNAADPNAITLKKTIVIQQPRDVIAYNNIALVIARDGLYQYDYSNPTDIQLLSKIPVLQ